MGGRGGGGGRKNRKLKTGTDSGDSEEVKDVRGIRQTGRNKQLGCQLVLVVGLFRVGWLDHLPQLILLVGFSFGNVCLSVCPFSC